MVEARYQFVGRCVTGSHQSEPNPKLAPNFSLREFERNDKTYFIHPNLILTLQNVRNLFGEGVTVISVDERGGATRGLCATISSDNSANLKRVCDDLTRSGSISKFADASDGLFIKAQPAPVNVISLEDAMDVAFYVTTGYETSGDPFQQVTGNFDKAGLSFGPAQVNFKTGTLVQQFRKLEAADATMLKECFDGGPDWNEWHALWDKPKTQQIAWADTHSTGPKKATVVDPWRSYLKRVGQVPAFRQEMKTFSKQEYGTKLRRALQLLKALWPDPITDLRCLCALYDLCTQQGSLDGVQIQIKARIDAEKPTDQRTLVQIACEERAKTASVEWRANCLSRRLGIFADAPVSATESGNTAKIDNPYFSMLPEMEVQGADGLVL